MREKRITNETDTDFLLFGVASPLKEYKFCFYLNSLIGSEFRKLNDLVFESADRSPDVAFSVFKAEDEESQNRFLVFVNKRSGEILLPEASGFDYILRLDGKFETNELENLLKGLKAIPEVVMATEIPVKRIKRPERLTYEEERPVQKLLRTKK